MKDDYCFDSEDGEFVRGFEAGMIWGHLTCGPPHEHKPLGFKGYISNCENYLRMAEALERELKVTIWENDNDNSWFTFEQR